MARIKVKFKADEKPEAVSRLVDVYIQKMTGNDTNENQ